MSNSVFNIGDIVVHKTTDKFKMSVVDNAPPENPSIKQLSDNYKDPKRYKCRYYNSDTLNWEISNFQESELKLFSE